MEKYLVGGAVRDILLGVPVTDRDWVIVGAKPHDLLNKGFIQVGRDFPVFLHPDTKEEHALARTERKSGQGYTGFVCDFDDTITLEQDLARRDLTINAVAMDENNQFIDPFNGIADINNRILRHVSPAFAEDPLRILRIARFAAKFHHLGFTIATETLQLMQSIVEQGEMQTLTVERVWKETEKALATHNPQCFFSVLRTCNALSVLYPEIDTLFNIKSAQENQRCLGKNNLEIHTLSALKHVALLTTQPEVRFATLCYNFDKTNTDSVNNPPLYQPSKQWALQQLNQLCKRLKIPNHFKKIANIACQYYDQVHNIQHLSSSEILELLNHIDVWRNPQYLQQLIAVSYADAKATNCDDDLAYLPKTYLEAVYKITKSVVAQDVILQGFAGGAIQSALTHHRILALEHWRNSIDTVTLAQ